MMPVTFAKRIAMKQAARIEAEDISMDEYEEEAHLIVKELEREGIRGKNVYSDVVKMLELGKESGAVKEKIRGIYGDF